jgi:peptide/nickel transport system permease protein
MPAATLRRCRNAAGFPPHLAMLALIAGRIFYAALTLLGISLLVFIGASLLPGDVADALLGQAATPEATAALRQSMHLTDPAPLRYLHWLGGLLTGRLGLSLSSGLPVAGLIGSRLPNSLLLAALTTAVALPVALLLGIVATIAVILFAVELQWFPALSTPRIGSVADLFSSFTLPVLTLSLPIIAQMSRMTRAALIGTLDSSYVEMAWLKGLRPGRVVLRHALPNAAGPIANAAALSLSWLLGGVIVVEVIFNYPGLAKLMVDAVATRDMPLIQACAMIFCAGYMVLVLLADICSVLSNPRLRPA